MQQDRHSDRRELHWCCRLLCLREEELWPADRFLSFTAISLAGIYFISLHFLFYFGQPRQRLGNKQPTNPKATRFVLFPPIFPQVCFPSSSAARRARRRALRLQRRPLSRVPPAFRRPRGGSGSADCPGGLSCPELRRQVGSGAWRGVGGSPDLSAPLLRGTATTMNVSPSCLSMQWLGAFRQRGSGKVRRGCGGASSPAWLSAGLNTEVLKAGLNSNAFPILRRGEEKPDCFMLWRMWFTTCSSVGLFSSECSSITCCCWVVQ